MGDPLGSLIQESQKRTILCVIGVGCYRNDLTVIEFLKIYKLAKNPNANYIINFQGR
jgi:hypothetical protein